MLIFLSKPMTLNRAPRLSCALATVLLAVACSKAPPDTPAVAAAGGEHHHMSDSGMMAMPVTIPKGAIYREADVRFMQGMIAHHSQAIFMTSLAASHGASKKVLFLASKIDQSQAPEIKLMQSWLADKNQYVPDTSSYHGMVMPGMLTPQQITDLQNAKGKDFDRQFLTLMIQHHEGALKMVADLMATPGAAQDVDVSVFANDVDATQTAEIAQMRELLADL
jgi:uncharacterized protein (DUF305 family)